MWCRLSAGEGSSSSARARRQKRQFKGHPWLSRRPRSQHAVAALRWLSSAAACSLRLRNCSAHLNHISNECQLVDRQRAALGIAHAGLLPRMHEACHRARMYTDRVQCDIIREALKFINKTPKTFDASCSLTHIKRKAHNHIGLHITHTYTSTHKRMARHANSRRLPHLCMRISTPTHR